MLFVALNPVLPGAIDLVLDAEGVARLRAALDQIAIDENHIHLRGPSAGGSDLDETSPWGGRGLGEIVLTWAGE